MEIAERLVGFGEEALHFLAQLVGKVIVHLLEHGPAERGQPLLGPRVVPVDGHARPERVFVNLKSFFGGIHGQRARAALGLGVSGIDRICAAADRKRIDPLGCRADVPEGEGVGLNLGGLADS